MVVYSRLYNCEWLKGDLDLPRVEMDDPSDEQELSCCWELGTSEEYFQCDGHCCWRTGLALPTVAFSYLKTFTNVGLF